MTLSLFDRSQSAEVIALFSKVFGDSEGKDEGKVIGHLVSKLINTTAPDDLIGFVAHGEDQIIGSIFFSRLKLSDAPDGFMLSPVAISTDRQGQGLGQQLIRYGLDYFRAKDIDLIITYGDPNYYGKVGFASLSEETIKAPFPLSHPHGWLAQSLKGKPLQLKNITSECVSAFQDPQYW